MSSSHSTRWATLAAACALLLVAGVPLKVVWPTIQLQPSYPDAHINLAVVYASQEPPYKELARYHYQLAQQAGHGKDPRLERLIDGAE